MSKIIIAADLKLPSDFATQTVFICGKRGSGKSSTGARIAEQLDKCNCRFAVLDPPDAWWGLKSSRDGKSPGIQAYVFGGRHADLPLESGAGALLADVVVDHRVNVIMSMRHFSNLERSRFAIDFAARLFARNTEPLMLFCEEAHRLFPQSREEYGKGARVEEMLGAMNKLLTEGRTSGIGVTVISQRPALVHATARNQAEVLVAHRIIGPHDRDAVEGWVKYHHQDEESRGEFLASLATLKTGECWFWGPEYPEDNPIGLRRIRVLMPETYDSRRTPKPGEHRTDPKVLAPIDIEKLRDKMAATIERAKAEDPKFLKSEVARLKRELATKQPAAAPAKTVQVADPRAIDRAVKEVESKYRTVLAQHETLRKKIVQEVGSVAKRLGDIASHLMHLGGVESPKLPEPKFQHMEFSIPGPVIRPIKPNPNVEVPQHLRRSLYEEGRVHDDGVDKRLRPGALRMLAACAMWYPKGIREGQVASQASVKRSGGSFSSYKSNLVTQGLIKVQGDLYYATEAGMELAGNNDTQAPSNTEEVVALWAPKLRPGAMRMLEKLIYANGDALSDEELSVGAQVEMSGGSFSSYLSNLVTAGLARRPQRGYVEAVKEALFL